MTRQNCIPEAAGVLNYLNKVTKKKCFRPRVILNPSRLCVKHSPVAGTLGRLRSLAT